MANTLSEGSGAPGIPLKITDLSVASVVIRVGAVAPTDADWGNETPPDGTLYLDNVADELYVRSGGAWVSTALT